MFRSPHDADDIEPRRVENWANWPDRYGSPVRYLLNERGLLVRMDGQEITTEEWSAWKDAKIRAEYAAEAAMEAVRFKAGVPGADRRIGGGIEWNRSDRK